MSLFSSWMSVFALVFAIAALIIFILIFFSVKNMKYIKYVSVHKWHVMKACIKLGKQQGCLATMIWRGLFHDMSKFHPAEWFPYLEYFYGAWRDVLDPRRDFLPPKFIDRNFDMAWAAHIHKNKHHWQHWILHKDNGDIVLLDMPISYTIEMVADWIGAGIAITGKDNTKEWYDKNKHKQKMSETTRMNVELLLEPLSKHSTPYKLHPVD